MKNYVSHTRDHGHQEKHARHLDLLFAIWLSLRETIPCAERMKKMLKKDPCNTNKLL